MKRTVGFMSKDYYLGVLSFIDFLLDKNFISESGMELVKSYQDSFRIIVCYLNKMEGKNED